MKSFLKSFCLFYFLVGIIAYFFSANLLIILFFGLLPSLLACSVDSMPNNYLSKIVILFNILGLTTMTIPIHSADNVDIAAFLIASKPISWFIVYSFCAMGWIFYFILPRLISIVIKACLKTNKKNLEIRLTKISESINQ